VWGNYTPPPRGAQPAQDPSSHAAYMPHQWSMTANTHGEPMPHPAKLAGPLRYAVLTVGAAEILQGLREDLPDPGGIGTGV
jgi:hypothetical protein